MHHQHNVDKKSSFNGYTIREWAIKSCRFEFKNRELSELVTNCECLLRNGNPLN